MNDLLRRRRAMMDNAQQFERIGLLYWYGLSRKYGIYDNYSSHKNRAATTTDIIVPYGHTMKIAIPDTVQVAVGAWDKDTKDLMLYGSWNSNLTYTPTGDSLVKLVFRKISTTQIENGELDGITRVTVGNKHYII
jgi:hypothetical protein